MDTAFKPSCFPVPAGRCLVGLFRAGSALAATTVAATGAIVLAGWWLDIAALKSLLPQWVTMKPNTALGFLLAGLALGWLRAEAPGARARRAGLACAGLVALLGLLTLAEMLGGWDLGIDNILFPEPAGAVQTHLPGRMAPATAFNFLFSGLALLLLNTRTRRGMRPSQWIILPPLAVAFLVVIGYMHGVEALYHVQPFSSVALHTALAFAILAVGILSARPEQGWMAVATSDLVGGVVVRRLIPVVLVVIPLLFWVRLLGERQGYYHTEFGIAVMVLVNVVILCGVSWWSALSLNRTETGRLQAEAQLRKLSLAVEQSPENVVITNLEGEIEYVNAAFVRNTGYSREEVIGRNPRLLQSGKTRRETHEALWDALTHGRSWKGEFINKRKDGSEYVDFSIISPLRQADGRISHYVGVQEDITERKRMALDLDAHRRNLETLVIERTAELAKARDEAERLTRVKSEFLANMSHEIRTPMNAIVGLASVLGKADLPAEPKALVRKIQLAGRSLLGIINDILDFSKIEAGRIEIEQAPFHLDDIFDNLASLMSASAGEKDIELAIRPPCVPLGLLRGDALRLGQVLINLACNAIKFTGRGRYRADGCADAGHGRHRDNPTDPANARAVRSAGGGANRRRPQGRTGGGHRRWHAGLHRQALRGRRGGCADPETGPPFGQRQPFVILEGLRVLFATEGHYAILVLAWYLSIPRRNRTTSAASCAKTRAT